MLTIGQTTQCQTISLSIDQVPIRTRMHMTHIVQLTNKDKHVYEIQ
jgi:hypothetical protein